MMRLRTLCVATWLMAVGCGGPMTPPSDEANGLGGKDGVGDPWRPTPADRTSTLGRHEPRELLPAEAQDVVSSAYASVEFIDSAAASAPPELGAMLDAMANRRRHALRKLGAAIGYVPVERGALASFEAQALRTRVNGLDAQSREPAIRQELLARARQDLAALQPLLASTHAPLQTFATAMVEALQVDIAELGGGARPVVNSSEAR